MNIGRILVIVTLVILLVSFIVNFTMEYIKSHKTDIPQTRYSYKITFKNKAEEEGELTANNIMQAGQLLLNSQYNVANKGKQMIYHNSDEIQTFYIQEINK